MCGSKTPKEMDNETTKDEPPYENPAFTSSDLRPHTYTDLKKTDTADYEKYETVIERI